MTIPCFGRHSAPAHAQNLVYDMYEVEQIVRHIQEVIKLEEGNEYGEGVEDKARHHRDEQ